MEHNFSEDTPMSGNEYDGIGLNQSYGADADGNTTGGLVLSCIGAV